MTHKINLLKELQYSFLLLLMLCYSFSVFSQDSNMGIYAGVNLSSFSRANSLPVAPLSENYMIGYETGLHLPLVSNKNYEAIFLLGYAQFGAKETFRINDQILESELKFQSVKGSILPIILKFGSEDFKFLFGGGGYLQYGFSNSFNSNPHVEFVQEDDLFTKLMYGAQARVGFIYKSWRLTADAYNSVNNLINLATEDTITTRGLMISLSKIFGSKNNSELPNQ